MIMYSNHLQAGAQPGTRVETAGTRDSDHYPLIAEIPYQGSISLYQDRKPLCRPLCILCALCFPAVYEPLSFLVLLSTLLLCTLPPIFATGACLGSSAALESVFDILLCTRLRLYEFQQCVMLFLYITCM